MGKAKLSKNEIDVMKDLQQEKKKQAGFNRQSYTGVVGQAVTATSGKSGATSLRNDGASYLPSTGGTLVGPLALHPKLCLVSSGEIIINEDNGSVSGISSRIIVTGEGAAADDLDTITGAKHAGQLLFLQPILTTPITLKHGTGNIIIPGATDYTIAGGEVVVLIFDTAVSGGGNNWTVVANFGSGGGGSGGMNQDLSNMTAPTAPTVDLNMNNNDITGVANIDLDGIAATVEGVVNLQFYHTNNSINSFGGDMLYQTSLSNEHTFIVGGSTKFRVTSSAIEMNQGVDMNDNSIVQVQKIEFSNSTSDNITSSSTGITYNVNSTDEHFFNVGGTTKMEVDSGEIEMFDDVRMNNNTIYEVSNLRFNTSGQVITTSSSELLYQVPSGDVHGFYVAAQKTVEVNQTYLEMQPNKYIDFGANISLSASSGFVSLPSNPLGFIICRVNGGLARIPYYGT